jgi:hypothetical protein
MAEKVHRESPEGDPARENVRLIARAAVATGLPARYTGNQLKVIGLNDGPS